MEGDVQRQGKKKSPTAGELEAMKERLVRRKREIWREVADDLENDVSGEYQDLIQTIRDQGDTALAELREITAFSLIELKVQELENIEAAIARIEQGEYGRCMDCGGWINPDRLEILPYTTRCRHCQAEKEKLDAATR